MGRMGGDRAWRHHQEVSAMSQGKDDGTLDKAWHTEDVKKRMNYLWAR